MQILSYYLPEASYQAIIQGYSTQLKDTSPMNVWGIK